MASNYLWQIKKPYKILWKILITTTCYKLLLAIHSLVHTASSFWEIRRNIFWRLYNFTFLIRYISVLTDSTPKKSVRRYVLSRGMNTWRVGRFAIWTLFHAIRTAGLTWISMTAQIATVQVSTWSNL